MDAADKYGDSPDRIEQVRAWRDAAIADGWTAQPTYPHTEPVESAATLQRDGWLAMIFTRDRGPKEAREPRTRGYARFEAHVSVWAPDSMAIHEVPKVYSWDALQAGQRTCGYCQATDVDTSHVGFAGRCCAVCLPTVRPQVEYPGWAE
jgi:hypothetical protein